MKASVSAAQYIRLLPSIAEIPNLASGRILRHKTHAGILAIQAKTAEQAAAVAPILEALRAEFVRRGEPGVR